MATVRVCTLRGDRGVRAGPFELDSVELLGIPCCNGLIKLVTEVEFSGYDGSTLGCMLIVV
jgi:hypothetical protein